MNPLQIRDNKNPAGDALHGSDCRSCSSNVCRRLSCRPRTLKMAQKQKSDERNDPKSLLKYRKDKDENILGGFYPKR
ncbi:uncharacterized protein V6R79_008923 [Siganus canaliculatus]